MEETKTKLFFRPLAVMLALSIVFFFGSSIGYLQAPGDQGQETAEEEKPAEEEQVNIICQQEMKKFSDEQMVQYRDWLERHFQNKSSTASLLTDAIARYKNLRTTLLEKYYTYVPQQNALQLTEGLEGPDCRRLYVDDILKEARRLLESKSSSTSSVKSSTILLNKYQDMNDKLALLTRNFLKMKAYLDTFAAKLPCYINRSCNKG